MFGKKLIDKAQHATLLREALQIQDENLRLRKENKAFKELLGNIVRSINDTTSPPKESYEQFRKHI